MLVVLFAEFNCLVHITKLIGYQLQSLLGVAHTTYKHHKYRFNMNLPLTIILNFKSTSNTMEAIFK